MTESFAKIIRKVSELKTRADRLSGKCGMSLTTAFNKYAIMHLYRG